MVDHQNSGHDMLALKMGSCKMEPSFILRDVVILAACGSLALKDLVARVKVKTTVYVCIYMMYMWSIYDACMMYVWWMYDVYMMYMLHIFIYMLIYIYIYYAKYTMYIRCLLLSYIYIYNMYVM